MVFAPLVSRLSHASDLNFQVVIDHVAKGHIKPVAVKDFNRIPISYTSFPIDENFIVKGQVDSVFFHGRFIQGDI